MSDLDKRIEEIVGKPLKEITFGEYERARSKIMRESLDELHRVIGEELLIMITPVLNFIDRICKFFRRIFK